MKSVDGTNFPTSAEAVPQSMCDELEDLPLPSTLSPVDTDEFDRKGYRLRRLRYSGQVLCESHFSGEWPLRKNAEPNLVPDEFLVASTKLHENVAHLFHAQVFIVVRHVIKTLIRN